MTHPRLAGLLDAVAPLTLHRSIDQHILTCLVATLDRICRQNPGLTAYELTSPYSDHRSPSMLARWITEHINTTEDEGLLDYRELRYRAVAFCHLQAGFPDSIVAIADRVWMFSHGLHPHRPIPLTPW